MPHTGHCAEQVRADGQRPFAVKPAVKMPAAFLGLISLILLLGGCGGSLPDQVVPGDILSFTKESLNLVVARETDRVVARLDPSIDTERGRQGIKEVYKLIPAEPPKGIRIIGFRQSLGRVSGGTNDYSLLLVYDFSSEPTVISVSVRQNGENYSLLSLGVTPARALEEKNRFSLTGKGPATLLFLLLWIAVAIVIMATTVACVRTPELKRKWLWIIFILFGLGEVSLNWSTDAVIVNPLSFHVPGVGFSKPLYQPVTLTLWVPVGAIAFWLRRSRRLREA
jgi:hypothetical protein